ncbi:hypothetical protein PVK06_025297 [Gossypium arboreum]|uniref:RNase H type-1 domain-containing protein n=1 Tax=Gossypium arboreum TaxID=29729 RepID=A0ABR0PG39_GOSAR|nr:hypothetical protein PVK06_025297 [Gossypium arboreum]
MAEAMACLQAVTMAEEMGFQDILVEGDALTIIRKLNSAEDDKSSISSLIKEIKGRGNRFRRLRFEYVPREANKMAHGMALEGRQHENSQYWIEEAPLAMDPINGKHKAYFQDLRIIPEIHDSSYPCLNPKKKGKNLESHTIRFSVSDFKYFLRNVVYGNIQPEYQNFFTFLSWFHPLDHWLNMITNEQMRTLGHEVVIIFYKPQYFVQCGRATKLGSFPTTWIQMKPCTLIMNTKTCSNIFASLIELSHLKFGLLHILMLHGKLCQMALQLFQALQEYKDDIPDLTGWFQEYHMCCSQVEIERITLHNSSVQDDKHEVMCKDINSNSENSMNSIQFPHSNANS